VSRFLANKKLNASETKHSYVRKRHLVHPVGVSNVRQNYRNLVVAVDTLSADCVVISYPQEHTALVSNHLPGYTGLHGVM
jgi:hypothetical protein